MTNGAGPICVHCTPVRGDEPDESAMGAKPPLGEAVGWNPPDEAGTPAAKGICLICWRALRKRSGRGVPVGSLCSCWYRCRCICRCCCFCEFVAPCCPKDKPGMMMLAMTKRNGTCARRRDLIMKPPTEREDALSYEPFSAAICVGQS